MLIYLSKLKGWGTSGFPIKKYGILLKVKETKNLIGVVLSCTSHKKFQRVTQGLRKIAAYRLGKIISFFRTGHPAFYCFPQDFPGINHCKFLQAFS